MPRTSVMAFILFICYVLFVVKDKFDFVICRFSDWVIGLFADLSRQVLELDPIFLIHPDIDVIELQPVQLFLIWLDVVDAAEKTDELIPLLLEKVDRCASNLKIIGGFTIGFFRQP